MEGKGMRRGNMGEWEGSFLFLGARERLRDCDWIVAANGVDVLVRFSFGGRYKFIPMDFVAKLGFAGQYGLPFTLFTLDWSGTGGDGECSKS